LVLVQDEDKVSEISACLQQAAASRVTPRAGGRVLFKGRTLDPRLTVAEAGLVALDRVDVIPEEG
jgi:hypothetical protein